MTEPILCDKCASEIKFVPPTFEECYQFCKSVGLTKEDAEYCWFRWDSNGWKIAGARMKRWKSAVKSWQAAGYFPSQKKKEWMQTSPTFSQRATMNTLKAVQEFGK